MKILLVCANGMSTSIIVQKMKAALSPEESHFEITAKPIDQFPDIYSSFDVVLLAPQVKYKLKEFESIAKQNNVPVGVMDRMDYGLGNGEKILNYAKELSS